MGMRKTGWIVATFLVALAACPAQIAQAQNLFGLISPEQKEICVRDPGQLPPVPLPDVPPPPTVAQWPAELDPLQLSLDEAIRTSLANSNVIRVLAGVQAVSSGSTIYDTAAQNTLIDQETARFNPTINVKNSFDRTETPTGLLDDIDPTQAAIRGLRTDAYRLGVGVKQPTVTGGSLDLGVNSTPRRFQPGVFPLNPESRSSLELSYTQPLLQGGGVGVNLAPIVLARIETERSFFQFKDSVQDMVRGVVEAYWSLVFARTDVWVLDQQVRQLQFAYDRADAQFRIGLVSRAELAQTKVSLVQFRGPADRRPRNVLQREAALRNILGLPPMDLSELIPTTPPVKEQLELEWQPLLALATERRPDIVELKLVLEADQQQLLLAQNQALPNLSAVGLYRWNGLEGEMPVGDYLSTRPGEYTDWTLAVNFSVPLGLRRERASLRQRELILARDRANLDQGVHQTTHQVALTLRNLSQYYQQYQAYAETRAAAKINLEQQIAEYRNNRVIFLNVLLAINDWGNAVRAEAQSLLLYNTELANLERQTGTILETHGIRFYEERFGSIGPLGRMLPPHSYPGGLPPTPNNDRYVPGEQPAENAFNLEDPLQGQRRRTPSPEELPPPVRIAPPDAEGGTDHALTSPQQSRQIVRCRTEFIPFSSGIPAIGDQRCGNPPPRNLRTQAEFSGSAGVSRKERNEFRSTGFTRSGAASIGSRRLARTAG